MKAGLYFIIIILAFAAISCAKAKIDTSFGPETPKWQAAKDLSYRYFNAENKADRIEIAKKGVFYSDLCVDESPTNPACYYFRAVLTGLYYQSRVVGYQNGLKSMIADCEKIITLDPDFEYGGAYRMMGQIYTEVPAAAMRPDSIIRDLEKAVDYLRRAAAIAPKYPENYIALAKAYLKAGDRDKAAEFLDIAKTLLPEWRGHADYPFWKEDIKRLAKRLKTRTK